MIYKNIRNEINVNTSTVQSLSNNSEKENLESWNLKLPKKLYLKFSTVSWKTLQKKKKKKHLSSVLSNEIWSQAPPAKATRRLVKMQLNAIGNRLLTEER